MNDEPEGREPEDEQHWTLDLPEGATAEDLAASLVREASAIAELDAEAVVYIRRGDNEWLEVTPEMRRERRQR